MALQLSVVGGLCSFIDFGKVMLIYTSWEPAWQIQWVGTRSDIARSSCPRWNHFDLESHYEQEQKFAKEPARSTFISQWNRCISSHNNMRESPFVLILYCCPFFFLGNPYQEKSNFQKLTCCFLGERVESAWVAKTAIAFPEVRWSYQMI